MLIPAFGGIAYDPNNLEFHAHEISNTQYGITHTPRSRSKIECASLNRIKKRVNVKRRFEEDNEEERKGYDISV
jgi:hypothetical protein